MPGDENFQTIFDRLKQILEPFASRLIVKTDEPGTYALDTPYSEKYKKNVYFGGVQIHKNYVSYYLMPLYGCPDLLEDLSPALKKRMQGKACFNFKALDEDLIIELATLTEIGLERFKRELTA